MAKSFINVCSITWAVDAACESCVECCRNPSTAKSLICVGLPLCSVAVD
jgi:hypothetical protein